jgi:hypothetical protein
MEKEIYLFNEYGIYIGKSIATNIIKSTGRIILPAYSTNLPVPDITPFQIAVFESEVPNIGDTTLFNKELNRYLQCSWKVYEKSKIRLDEVSKKVVELTLEEIEERLLEGVIKNLEEELNITISGIIQKIKRCNGNCVYIDKLTYQLYKPANLEESYFRDGTWKLPNSDWSVYNK